MFLGEAADTNSASIFWANVFAGTVGNLVFFALIVILGLVIAILPSRRLLLTLFSPPGRSLEAITIVTAAIRIPAPHDAMGVFGHVGRYPNVSTPAMEAAAAHLFKSALLLAFPDWVGLPPQLRGLTIGSAQIDVVPSPLTKAEVPMSGCLICMGGGFFNWASVWAEKLPGNQISAQPHLSLNSVPISSNTQCAVSRTFDEANKRYVFWIVGTSEEATSAGLVYLAKNWRTVAKRYPGPNNFSFLVEWTGHKSAPRLLHWSA